MTTAVTLLFSDQLYAQAQYLANQRHQKLEKLLVEESAEVISAKIGFGLTLETVESELESTYEPDETVDRERDAYVAMHPLLKQKFLGKHVAIYGGQLVDFDDDYAALYKRIDAKYPNDFVWLDTVQEYPIETASLRLPTFIED